MQERRRLSRDRDDRMLGGVCAGIGRHYNLDPTIVRVVFVLLALLSGFGIITYLVLWLLLPSEGHHEDPARLKMRENLDEMTERARLAADTARAAAEAARQAADQLAEATRATVTAARDTWQQGSHRDDAQQQGSAGSEVPPHSSEKPGETTPDGSESTWPPDRELPETEAHPPGDARDRPDTSGSA